MITWMGSNGSTDRDVDGEAHAAVDHGSGEMPGIIRTHKTTIFDCSCQFPKRWGCFCRHMACVYILTNTTSPPPGTMHPCWHVDQGPALTETFQAFLGPMPRHVGAAGMETDMQEPTTAAASSTTPMALRYHTIMHLAKQAAHISQHSMEAYTSFSTGLQELIDGHVARAASANAAQDVGRRATDAPMPSIFNPDANRSKRRRMRDGEVPRKRAARGGARGGSGQGAAIDTSHQRGRAQGRGRAQKGVARDEGVARDRGKPRQQQSTVARRVPHHPSYHHHRQCSMKQC